MAILKGAEAQAWLAANPGRKYKVLSNPVQDQSQDGLFMSLLKGMVKYSPGSGPVRDTIQNIKNVGLASGVKRVEAPVYSNEELLGMGGSEAFLNRPEMVSYQEALKGSQDKYKQLQSELANPTANANFNKIFNVSEGEQARQSGEQLYGITKDKPQGKVFSPAVNRGLVSALEVFLSAALAAGALPAAAAARLSGPGKLLAKVGAPLANIGGVPGIVARTGANLVEGGLEGFAESTPESAGKDVLWSALAEGAFGVPGEILGSVNAAKVMKNMDLGDLNRKTVANTLLSDQGIDQSILDDFPEYATKAKAYKSADEFVNALVDENGYVNPKDLKVYRGEGKGIGNTTFVSGEYFADSPEFASVYGDVSEDTIPKGAKVFDFDKIKGSPEQLIIPQEILMDPDETRRYLVERGFDYTRNTNLRGVEYVKLKTALTEPVDKLMDHARKFDNSFDFMKDVDGNFEPWRDGFEIYIERNGSDGIHALGEIWDKANRTNLSKRDVFSLKNVWDEASKQPGKFSKALQSQYKFTPKDLVREPNIELKNDMVVRDPGGSKITLKAGETYTPFKIEGTKKVALRDGKDYVIQAGDYERALQSSKRAIAQPFIPKEYQGVNVEEQSRRGTRSAPLPKSEKWIDSISYDVAKNKDLLHRSSTGLVSRLLGVPSLINLKKSEVNELIDFVADYQNVRNMSDVELADYAALRGVDDSEIGGSDLRNSIRDDLRWEIDDGSYLEDAIPGTKLPRYERLLNVPGNQDNYKELIYNVPAPKGSKITEIPKDKVVLEAKDLKKYMSTKDEQRLMDAYYEHMRTPWGGTLILDKDTLEYYAKRKELFKKYGESLAEMSSDQVKKLSKLSNQELATITGRKSFLDLSEDSADKAEIIDYLKTYDDIPNMSKEEFAENFEFGLGKDFIEENTIEDLRVEAYNVMDSFLSDQYGFSTRDIYNDIHMNPGDYTLRVGSEGANFDLYHGRDRAVVEKRLIEDLNIKKGKEYFAPEKIRTMPEYKKWLDVQARDILKRAKEGGYSGVTFSTPQEVAGRYDLDQYADSISWKKGDLTGTSQPAKDITKHFKEHPAYFSHAVLTDIYTDEGKFLNIYENQNDIEQYFRNKGRLPDIADSNKWVTVKVLGKDEPIDLDVGKNGVVNMAYVDGKEVEYSHPFEFKGRPLKDFTGEELANRILKESSGKINETVPFGGLWPKSKYGDQGILAKALEDASGKKLQVLNDLPGYDTLVGWSKVDVGSDGQLKKGSSIKIGKDSSVEAGDIVINPGGDLESARIMTSTTRPGQRRSGVSIPFDVVLHPEKYGLGKYPGYDKDGNFVNIFSYDRAKFPSIGIDSWEVNKWKDSAIWVNYMENDVIPNQGYSGRNVIRFDDQLKRTIAGEAPNIKTTKQGEPTQEWVESLLNSQSAAPQVKSYSHLGLDDAGDWKNIPTRNAGEFALILAKEGKLKPEGKSLMLVLKDSGIPLEGVDFGQIIARIKEVI